MVREKGEGDWEEGRRNRPISTILITTKYICEQAFVHAYVLEHFCVRVGASI